MTRRGSPSAWASTVSIRYRSSGGVHSVEDGWVTAQEREGGNAYLVRGAAGTTEGGEGRDGGKVDVGRGPAGARQMGTMQRPHLTTASLSRSFTHSSKKFLQNVIEVRFGCGDSTKARSSARTGLRAERAVETIPVGLISPRGGVVRPSYLAVECAGPGRTRILSPVPVHPSSVRI